MDRNNRVFLLVCFVGLANITTVFSTERPTEHVDFSCKFERLHEHKPWITGRVCALLILIWLEWSRMSKFGSRSPFLTVMFAYVLLILPCVFATEQFKEEEFRIPKEQADFSCKTELIKKYQPGITARWFKDGFPVNETKRITIDKGTNALWMSKLKLSDHGVYTCKVTYKVSYLVSNEVKLHMGSEHFTMGEGDSWAAQPTQGLGAPNIWSTAMLFGAGLAVIWVVIIVVLQLKWKKRKQIPGQLQTDDHTHE